MSFLDNLENNLSRMENASDRTGEASDEAKRRNADRERTLATSQWADQLKRSEWTSKLMQSATREGFGRRTKVYITWIGENLRLEAKETRLELKPQTDGVEAQFAAAGNVTKSRRLQLTEDPAELVREWLAESDAA